MSFIKRPNRLHAPFPEGGEGREYLIWSHKWGCWHCRSDTGGASGYTSDILRAGIFDRANAHAYHDERVAKLSHRDNSAVHVRDQMQTMAEAVAAKRAEADKAEARLAMFKAALP